MNIDRPENPPAFDVPALENHNSFVYLFVLITLVILVWQVWHTLKVKWFRKT